MYRILNILTIGSNVLERRWVSHPAKRRRGFGVILTVETWVVSGTINPIISAKRQKLEFTRIL